MNAHQIKLIDNTYQAEEARELVLALINDKIKFLQHKIFSMKERFGADTTRMEQRVAELKEEKKQFLLAIDALEDKQSSFDIKCEVMLKAKVEEPA